MLRRLLPELNQVIKAMERDVLKPNVFNKSFDLDSFDPLADIHETDNGFVIEAEVPGVKKDDLTMELVDDSTLSIRGKIERQQEGSLWSSERTFGSFQRLISLPTKIDPEQVKASLKDGILKVELQKTELPAQRRIPIEGVVNEKQIE